MKTILISHLSNRVSKNIGYKASPLQGSNLPKISSVRHSTRVHYLLMGVQYSYSNRSHIRQDNSYHLSDLVKVVPS